MYPPIILHGGQLVQRAGTEKSKGTKVFAVTGAVNNIAWLKCHGHSLRSIIYDIGGGIKGKRKFKGADGRPSAVIPESLVDTRGL